MGILRLKMKKENILLDVMLKDCDLEVCEILVNYLLTSVPLDCLGNY